MLHMGDVFAQVACLLAGHRFPAITAIPDRLLRPLHPLNGRKGAHRSAGNARRARKARK